MRKPCVSIMDHRVLDKVDLTKKAQGADPNASSCNSVTHDCSTQCLWCLSDFV